MFCLWLELYAFVLSFLLSLSSCEVLPDVRHVTFNIPIRNMRLTNHVIAYHRLESRYVCMEACYLEPNCVSINYYPSPTEYDNCELSSSDRHLSPEDFVRSEGTVYAGIQNHCHSIECPKRNMTCQSGFVPKGYRCVHPLCYEGPLGMEDGRIPDSSITASSEFGDTYLTKNARLGKSCYKCLWAAKTRKAGEYLQVDLGMKMAVTKVATQGNKWAEERVTGYHIAYSLDGMNWQNHTRNGTLIIFDGNIVKNSIVTNDIVPFIKARVVRIVAQTWNVHISLTAELYGCKLP